MSVLYRINWKWGLFAVMPDKKKKKRVLFARMEL